MAKKPTPTPTRNVPARAARNEVTAPPKKSTAVAVAAAPKKLGRGFEETDQDSFSVPFLVVLQSNSPALREVKGARAGLIMNTATNELHDSLTVIPIHFQRRFIRWAPRDLGGGFKGMFEPAAAAQMEADGEVARDEGNRLFFPLPDGTINDKKCDQLRDTRQHYVLIRREDGSTQPAIIGMSSTQIKKSRNWLSTMRMAGGDMWSRAYDISTVGESNEKGHWDGWVIEVAEDPEVNEAEAMEAENFWTSISSGAARAATDTLSGQDD